MWYLCGVVVKRTPVGTKLVVVVVAAADLTTVASSFRVTAGGGRLKKLSTQDLLRIPAVCWGQVATPRLEMRTRSRSLRSRVR